MLSESILVIEDEEDLLELISYNLIRAGYQVSGETSGEEGLLKARLLAPNLVILDLMLPEISGLEICKSLKADPATQLIPIIIVSAKGEPEDIVQGLEQGAEDYLTKPFVPKVLLARVQSVLRRQKINGTQATIQVHDITINPGRYEVFLRGSALELTLSEFRLLHFLASHRGWVYTRNQIVDAVRGEGYSVTERSVDVQIVGLRKKLGDSGSFIETVRGIGYRFKE